MEDAVERAAALREYAEHTAGCTRCALSKGRTQVVFGSGSPNADLMFVGEAPGFHEDQQGVPFVGQAGKLLDKLLAGIGLTRADVFVANVLKCLRYTAQVQLGDGSWERIGRLVRSRYDGTVMSVDDNGRLVPRRVIGWHATPRAGRRIFKLSYRSAKSAGLARVGVELTGDHPVLTMRGYVPAEELRPTDRIATGQGLSRLAHDVVCGTVLGDGHLNAASNHLFFAHSDSQSEYAAFKASLLEELEPRLQTLAVAAVAGGARTYGAVHVRTLAHRALGVLRRDFYRPKKHVPAWLGEELNDRMLAIWFMDDGYTRIRSGGRQPLAEIATVGFEDRDLQVLLRGLECLGLPAKAMRGRIYFDVSATAALSELIAPYVPASMRYKLHPEVEQRVPYDPDRLRRGETEVLYDEVEIEEIVRHEGPDRTYFCIDVEETHNFVTAGGVVHNCRPPGNRDPLPDEIAACEPHLFRQIELIEPKLVATLGNFATKLLSGKPAGITR
ncbi:MAG TPA: uracil-DNA glycosylase family protein, partial [Gaiellaceae bacterium]